MLNGYKGTHRRIVCVRDACDNLVPLRSWRSIFFYLELVCRVAQIPIAGCSRDRQSQRHSKPYTSKATRAGTYSLAVGLTTYNSSSRTRKDSMLKKAMG